MSERGKLLLQPGFPATHVKTDCERKKNEWVKRNNEIRKSQGVKSNATPFMDDDDNESISFEHEAIEMPPGHRNVRGHRDIPSPPQSVTPSPTQGLTSSPHTPSPLQNVTPPPAQELTSSPHTPSPPQNVTPSPTQGLTPSPHTPSPHQSGTPSQPQELTSSAPPIVAQSSQVSGTGPSSSKRVRGPTIGKSLDKFIAHHEGKKLVVTVPEEMKAFCGVNATMAATDLGVQIRRFCPIQGFAHSWKDVDPMAKKAILQSNRDKFDIVDGTEGNSLADAVTDKKASLLYKDWKCNMRRHYRKLRKAKVDPYSSPYPGMHMDDWKYLIDKVFKDPKIRVSYYLLVLNSYAEGNDSELPDFCKFFKKSHTLKKTKEWIKPTCAVLHAAMENARDEALESGVSLTHEELSTKVLGKGKNPKYLRGLGVGPTPTSLSFKSHLEKRAHSELLSIRSEMELLRQEQQREREEYQREREE
ncbi:hypothetical protein RHMOL_Rhmol01G0086900 [Rhododendron molle]|uniref:Uncharacterized protein n=1 Tax=Rhododendron molle TaxID=49168 RepID=A0ACC0PZ57_RHOML|nr:hypothetical protein RHMOL_Rhmol01G0086900 [Rhododendron molle]